MVTIKRIILDVLKPHQPNILEFSQAIAKVGTGYRVNSTVLEMDKNTETLEISIEANAIDFEAIQSTINEMGGSLHSIDGAEVLNEVNVN